jgi:hypothetical protein
MLGTLSRHGDRVYRQVMEPTDSSSTAGGGRFFQQERAHAHQRSTNCDGTTPLAANSAAQD